MTRTLMTGGLLLLCVAASLSHGATRKDKAGDLKVWVSEGRWPRGKNAVKLTPKKQLELAKRLEAIGDVRQAAEQYRRLADVYTEDVAVEEALILSSKNYLAAGDYTSCRKQIKELRRRFIHATKLDALGEVEVSLGRGFLEGKGEGGTYRIKSRIRKARKIFKQVLEDDAQGRWADDAMLGLGQCDEASKHYADAIKKYKKLIEKYPRSELRAEAESRIAFCINAREPRPEYSESDTIEARQRIQAAKAEAEQGDANLDMVALEENEQLLKDRQAQKRFAQAVFYAKNGKYRAAEIYFERLKKLYPKSKWSEKAEKALKEMRQR